MIAVRSNERAAAASGVGVFQTKLVAFAISGALAGLAGVLISFQYQAMPTSSRSIRSPRCSRWRGS